MSKYRWIEEGARYIYLAKAGKGDSARRGSSCTALTVPKIGRGPGNIRVRFEDGHTAIVPNGVLEREKAN